MNRKYLKEIIFNRYSHLNKTNAVIQCAKDLGVSKNVIYNIFKYQLPSEEVLEKFGKLFNIDYNKLFQKEENQ